MRKTNLEATDMTQLTEFRKHRIISALDGYFTYANPEIAKRRMEMSVEAFANMCNNRWGTVMGHVSLSEAQEIMDVLKPKPEPERKQRRRRHPRGDDGLRSTRQHIRGLCPHCRKGFVITFDSPKCHLGPVSDGNSFTGLCGRLAKVLKTDVVSAKSLMYSEHPELRSMIDRNEKIAIVKSYVEEAEAAMRETKGVVDE